MTGDNSILTKNLRPDRQGVRIDKTKYQRMRAAILANLFVTGSLQFKQLAAMVERQLGGSFEGSIIWYYTVVKLDLEARGEIARVKGSKSQMLEIVNKRELAF